MTNGPHVVKIADYLTDQSRALVGVKRGVELRKKSQIDKIDNRSENIKIVIPRGIWAINHTYWQGFLYNVIKKHGKEKFMEKYQIVSEDEINFTAQLNEAIYLIIKDEELLC